jgi:biotin transporter BioY
MDKELAAYFIFAAVVAFMLHLLSRRFFLVSLGGPVLCSVVGLWYYSWVANFNVNIAWAPFVVVWLFVDALPVTLVVGLPFLMLRRSRRIVRKTAKGTVADEL